VQLEEYIPIRLPFAYTVLVFDPDANLPRINRTLVYLGACIILSLSYS